MNKKTLILSIFPVIIGIIFTFGLFYVIISTTESNYQMEYNISESFVLNHIQVFSSIMLLIAGVLAIIVGFTNQFVKAPYIIMGVILILLAVGFFIL